MHTSILQLSTNFHVPFLQHILSLWPTEHCLTCNTKSHSVFVLLSKHTAIVLLSKHMATMRFKNSTQMLDYLTWDLTAYACGARKRKLYIVVFYTCVTQYPLLKIRDFEKEWNNARRLQDYRHFFKSKLWHKKWYSWGQKITTIFFKKLI